MQEVLDILMTREHCKDETAADTATMAFAGGKMLDASRPEGQTGIPDSPLERLGESKNMCT